MSEPAFPPMPIALSDATPVSSCEVHFPDWMGRAIRAEALVSALEPAFENSRKAIGDRDRRLAAIETALRETGARHVVVSESATDDVLECYWCLSAANLTGGKAVDHDPDCRLVLIGLASTSVASIPVAHARATPEGSAVTLESTDLPAGTSDSRAAEASKSGALIPTSASQTEEAAVFVADARVVVIGGLHERAVGTVRSLSHEAPSGERIWCVDLDGLRERLIRESLLRLLASPARLDPNGKAEPKTRLVARTESDPVGPLRTRIAPPANEYVAADGTRIPLGEVADRDVKPENIVQPTTTSEPAMLRAQAWLRDPITTGSASDEVAMLIGQIRLETIEECAKAIEAERDGWLNDESRKTFDLAASAVRALAKEVDRG